jgi:lupus La protein
MSAEAAVQETAPVVNDPNAEAAEEVKQMLAKLQGKSETAKEIPEQSSEKANGKVEESTASTEVNRTEATTEPKPKEAEPEKRQETRHRDSDRPSRGRGGGRGGFSSRNFKDNIKSDLTTLEESNDPVAIRKQVCLATNSLNSPHVY